MPIAVFTKNTTVQNSPYGAADNVYSGIEDAHLTESVPDGSSVGASPSIGAEPADSYTPVIRAAHIHQIPLNATNVQATVFVYFTGTGFGNITADARPLTKYWLPESASFNSYTTDLAWSTPGGDFGLVDDSETISGEGWFSWDISASAPAYIENPRLNYGWGIDPSGSGFRFFESSLQGTDGLRPEIHISYELPTASFSVLKTINKPPIKSITKSLLATGDGQSVAETPTVIEKSIFVYGHSLFRHDLFGATAFSNTGFTVGDISRQSSNKICIKQAFGQLRDQVIPPNQGNQQSFPTNQFDAWPESPVAAWQNSSWTDIIIMASNFEQQTKTAATFATESDAVLSYVSTNSPSSNIIIYEHWAEPGHYGYSVVNTNQMAAQDWSDYKDIHRHGGVYHTWHLDYQNQIVTNGYTVSMIPVGPIIMDALQNETYLSAISFEDLFVDGAPHGNTNMYFMAAIVVYMALYGEISTSFNPIQSSAINANIVNNLPSFVTFVESRLAFYGANGVTLP